MDRGGDYAGANFAYDYAGVLLADLNVSAVTLPAGSAEHPAIGWARSGAMALTGYRDGPPVMCPVPLASCADGALTALACLAGRPFPEIVRGAMLLSERAAVAGYQRNGSISPGGSCRFIEASDGWIALNLAREDDWRMLPAMFEREVAADWPAVAAAARDCPAETQTARGRELGLAVASHRPPDAARPWLQVIWEGGIATRRARPPIVVELASLWAGPLCGHLLQLTGARVIKVESPGRPDGARFGPPAFFDLMNAGKDSVAFDLSAAQGQEQLRALIRAADIVVEGSRPRALEQLGISATELVAECPGLTWIGITGYGRAGEAANWIAYGDDAGVAAGLSALLPSQNGPIFCGDAIGDPLTGLHAALAATARWQSGQGGLISLAIRDVVRHCIGFDEPSSVGDALGRARDWQSVLDREGISAAAPTARAPAGQARPLGADTASVLRELSAAC